MGLMGVFGVGVNGGDGQFQRSVLTDITITVRAGATRSGPLRLFNHRDSKGLPYKINDNFSN
jgi:hypothetical protein